jgi:glycosyltransferase involved in cell wall biosynthesis
MGNKKLKVSVVLAVYNGMETIERCLESLLHQTIWEKFEKEIIVIDDASTDLTEKIVQRYSVKFNKLEKRLGGAASRNEGIELATGDFIFIAEADAYYSPKYLELCLEHLIKDPKVGSVHGYIHHWPSKSILHNYWEEFRKLSQINYKPFSGWVFRRKDLNMIGLYNPKSASPDIDLINRLKKQGYTLKWEPKAEWWHKDPDSFGKIFRKGFNWGVVLFTQLLHRETGAKDSYYRIGGVYIILFLSLTLLRINILYEFFLLLVLGLLFLFLPIRAVLKKQQSPQEYKYFILLFPIVNTYRILGMAVGFIAGPLYVLFGKKVPF